MKKKPNELHPIKNRSSIEDFFKTIWHGTPPKLVGSKAETGYLTPNNKAKVTIRIKNIAETCADFKIGVMGDTLVRMDDNNYRSNFNFVQRVYKSTSKEIIKAYEVELIKKFKPLYPSKIQNISTSPASKLTTYNGYYYIYVVYNI